MAIHRSSLETSPFRGWHDLSRELDSGEWFVIVQFIFTLKQGGIPIICLKYDGLCIYPFVTMRFKSSLHTWKGTQTKKDTIRLKDMTTSAPSVDDYKTTAWYFGIIPVRSSTNLVLERVQSHLGRIFQPVVLLPLQSRSLCTQQKTCWDQHPLVENAWLIVHYNFKASDYWHSGQYCRWGGVVFCLGGPSDDTPLFT